MHVIRYNIFDTIGKADALCITTNGFINNKNKCIMGKGCAKQALDLWPDIDSVLAVKIKEFGNNVNMLTKVKCTTILSFPVKPESLIFDGVNSVSYMVKRYNVGDVIPGWAAKADLHLIEKSTVQLLELTNSQNWNKVVIPLPGCGAGEMDSNVVYPLLNRILDDRFYIMHL